MELSYGDGKRIEMLMENYFRKLSASLEELKQRMEKIEKKLDELRLPPGPHPPRPEVRPADAGHHPEEIRKGPEVRDMPPHREGVAPGTHPEEHRAHPEPERHEEHERPHPNNVPHHAPSGVGPRGAERSAPPRNERIGSLRPGDISIEKYFYAGRH